MTPEDEYAGAVKRMWCGVILQAFRDAMTPLRSARDHFDVNSARAYLVTRSPDLREVCENAGMDMNFVINRAKQFEKVGWVSKEEQERADITRKIKYLRSRCTVVGRRARRCRNPEFKKELEERIEGFKKKIDILIMKRNAIKVPKDFYGDLYDPQA